MNKWYSLLTLVSVLSLAACSGPDPKPEVVANGDAGTVAAVHETPVSAAQSAQLTTATPKISMSESIGVMQELRRNGCVVEKFSNVNHLHYSQLLITCGTKLATPE